MTFRNWIISLVLTGTAGVSQAHPNKCQHSHSNGTIIWEENCGGRSRALTSGELVGDHGDHASTEHHPKHNMLLFGTDEIFASHIVYKQPHNFQVILKVNLPAEAKQHYLFLRENDPESQIVLLLDPMDISEIETAQTLRATLQKRGSSNRIIVPQVVLQKEDFKVVFLSELPIDLRSEVRSSF